MNKISVYTIALTTATLAVSPYAIDEYSSAGGTVYNSLSLIAGQKPITGNDNVDCRKYLNSMLIRNSFKDRMIERRILNIPNDVSETLSKLSEECGRFDIKEVYADYSQETNAMRIDMVIDNGFFLIVRKTFDDGNDNAVAISVSKGDEQILADYIDANKIVEEVDKCMKA